jgi:pSer/pThr/pTyr-binding forkhead associated (FHA) protein
MSSLCLLDENGAAAQRWELAGHPLAVGRGASADVIVADATLSRRHFLIQPEKGHYWLKDLNSENGTYVDGRRAQAVRLHHHDCIAAGRTLFMFNEQNPG